MENWQELHGLYNETLSLISNNSKMKLLENLDHWYNCELREEIQKTFSINKQQLIQIAEWKMTRGVWRPRNKSLIGNNSDATVVKTTKESFKILQEETDISPESIKRSLSHLCKLEGIGPATASAVLSAFSSQIPFMSDEGLGYFNIPLKYTLSDYMCYYTKILALSKELKGDCSLRTLEQAIWVNKMKTISGTQNASKNPKVASKATTLSKDSNAKSVKSKVTSPSIDANNLTTKRKRNTDNNQTIEKKKKNI